VAPEELYGMCGELRRRRGPEHAVGRVIARPFKGPPPHYRRTDGRRDFSLAPPPRSYLQECQDAGVEVHAVGKVGQLFAGVGVDAHHPSATNRSALEPTTRASMCRCWPGSRDTALAVMTGRWATWALACCRGLPVGALPICPGEPFVDARAA
jgi:hypothetical protein